MLHKHPSRCASQHTASVLHRSSSSHESLGNIWFSVLEGTPSVWHAVRVWSVSIWTRRPTPAPASLLPLAAPPLRFQRLHNAFWQSPYCWPEDSVVDIRMKLLLNCRGGKNLTTIFWHFRDLCLPRVHKYADSKKVVAFTICMV